METNKKNAKLCLNGKKKLFVIHTTTKTGKNKKFNRKVPEESAEAN